MIRRILFFFILPFLFIACEDNTDCSSLTRNNVRLRMVNISPGLPNPYSLIFPANQPDSVITGTPLFGTVYDFRVNPITPTTTFYFDGPGLRDSLVLGYDVRYGIISELCGVEVIYSNLRIQQHSFDSIRLVTDSFNRLTELHIEIFF